MAEIMASQWREKKTASHQASRDAGLYRNKLANDVASSTAKIVTAKRKIATRRRLQHLSVARKIKNKHEGGAGSNSA